MNPRAVRRWINRLAQVLYLVAGDVAKDMSRASGAMVCADCGADYYSHAADPFLNGKRVKL